MPKNYKQKGVPKKTPLKAQVGAPLSRLNIPNLGFNNVGNSLDISKEISSTKNSLENKMKSKLTPGNGEQGFNFGNAINSAGQIASIAGALIPKGDRSALTTGLDSAYDGAADAIAAIPGFGPIASGAMKIGGLVSDGLTALGVGTDQVTTADKILDSKFLKLTPFGLINSIGAKRSDEFTLDTETQEQIGSSYEGTYDNFNNLQAGKKFGLFSNKARKNENSKIKDSTAQQSLMSGIANNAKDSLFAANNTQQTNLRNQYQLNGGINFSRLGKLGFKVENLKCVSKKLQDGGTFENYLKSLPLNLQDTTDYRVKLQWELSDKPKSFNEALEKKLFKWDDKDKSYHGNSVVFNQKDNKYEFLKSKKHKTVGLELDWFNGEDGKDFKNDWELYDDPNSDYYQYIPRKREFKEGGKMNVIPSGALHARKHTIEIDGITKKGIPVISKKEGGVTQHAEVEVDEIIFTLEVTQKLEELMKDGSDKAKIEAGKLIAEEILRNTEDNTGLIEKVQL